VPAQPGHPDLAGVHGDDADAADPEQRGDGDPDPQRAGEQGEHQADRKHHG
jgi:hypothetical protein